MLKITFIIFLLAWVWHCESHAQGSKSFQVDILRTGPSVDFSDFPDFAAIHVKSEIPTIRITSEISLISTITISDAELLLIVSPTEQRLVLSSEGYERKVIELPALSPRQIVWIHISDAFGTAVVDVSNPKTGRVWMDRNLGASRAATSPTDREAYGDLYQWGRATDGHEKRNSGKQSLLSASDAPSVDGFIVVTSGPYDWRSLKNDNLWQGSNEMNNPCPSGYRLPTEAEWNAERSSWRSNNAASAYQSHLRLPMSGYRVHSTGSLFNVGTIGSYWSTTTAGTDAIRFGFNVSNAYTNMSYRAMGNSVRCIKN